MERATHIPVMLQRVLELIETAVATVDNPVVVDMTLGLGGHTEAILERFDQVTVIGVDRDLQAIARAKERLARFGSRVRVVHGVDDQIVSIVQAEGFDAVDVVFFDLGVSSMQLDFAERGFAYAQDGPLDMRMNEQDDLTAADLLNTYTEDEIVRVLRDFGEEKFARRIASAIVEQRSESPFSTTAELVELIRRSIPAAARRTGRNPSKRTFQALRIEINDELGVFRRALADALELLNVGGRIVVLAYHSLEDRIAKRTFAEVTTLKVPRDLPVVPEHMKPKFRLVLRGAEKATDEEIETNPRATSVRLRVVERVAA